jgi:broad-specificity NMP kinase
MYANMEAEAELLVEAEAKAETKAETKVVEIELAAEDIEDIDNSIEDAIGTDYKKMSTNKLREVVVCKGLVPNASKLKKNELLKLLGDK